jgi:hypothetical protein
MADIKVVMQCETSFQVTVNAKAQTSHEVKLSSEYAQHLTQGHMSNQQLVHASFEFLLARESNTSILRSFDLSVIAKYFPEYEIMIQQLATQSSLS